MRRAIPYSWDEPEVPVEANSILIVGGGLVGETLAARLARDGYDVSLIEADGQRVRELADTVDVQVIEGNGATAPVLRMAGAEQASIVVAATESDECNVLVGFLASRLFETPRVVVRVRDPGHEEGFARASEEQISECVCVNPDTASVDRIASLLEVPGTVDVMHFLDGGVLVAGFRIGPSSDFAGMQVSDMRLLFASAPTLVVAIQRGRRWIVPDGTEKILAGDLVYFVIARQELGDVLSLVGAAPGNDARGRIMITGATSIGLALAKRLESRDERVVLLEQDAKLAQRAAEELDHVLVIQGSGTDQTLLEDEEIEHVSAFVAVTADHESNLVAGLLARRLGAGRSIVLVDNPAMVSMAGEIGIDAILSQRLLAVGLVLQHIRGGGVRSGASLLGDEVEIVEVEAKPGSRLTCEPLKRVGLPRGVLVAALQRGDEMVVPSGEHQIQEGDRVLIVAMADLVSKLTDFLEA
jgi:trk system potassium uptake protein TrkA